MSTSRRSPISGLEMQRTGFVSVKSSSASGWLLIVPVGRQKVKCISPGPLEVSLGSGEPPKEGKKERGRGRKGRGKEGREGREGRKREEGKGNKYIRWKIVRDEEKEKEGKK